MWRWHLSVISGLSLLLSFALGYVDKGLYSFQFLGRVADWIVILIWAVFIAIIPVLLYVFKKQGRAHHYLYGFLPTLAIIVFIILGDFV